MTHTLLALYGLKWNPFTADVPIEALWSPPMLEHFRWRMENQAREGGFALISGDPGTGKSVSLRLLAHHLASLPDLQIGVLTRPQSGLGDFYRELGALFGVVLAPHNRWAGFKALREKWLAHVDSTRHRPVLLVDEAQEMSPSVLAELRILASADFDSRAILTVVLAGDGRLVQEFRREELLPIARLLSPRHRHEIPPAAIPAKNTRGFQVAVSTAHQHRRRLRSNVLEPTAHSTCVSNNLPIRSPSPAAARRQFGKQGLEAVAPA